MNDALKSWIAFWGLLACSFAAKTPGVAAVLVLLAAAAYVAYCISSKESQP